MYYFKSVTPPQKHLFPAIDKIRGRGVYANAFDIGNGLLHWGFFIEYEQPEKKRGNLIPKNCQIPANQ